MSAGLPISRLVLHALGLLVLSVLVSGNGNALPQLFFERHYPEAKLAWLSACLLAGACAATAGVLAARAGRAGRGRVAALLVLAFGLELALFQVEDGRAYVALNALLQFGANYLVTQLDVATVARAGDRSRSANDGITNLARLLGMLIAPVLYTALYAQRAALYTVIAALAGLAIASSIALYSGVTPAEARSGGAAPSTPADRGDRLFFGYAIALYSALYLLAANLSYLLRDVVGIEDAALRAGTTISVVFAAAVVGNVVASALSRGRAHVGPRLTSLLAPAGVLAILAGLIGGYDGLPYGVVLGGGAAIGFSYGFFLLEVREYASRGARDANKAVLLVYFNNMANLSSIVGFAALAAIALVSSGPDSFTLVLALIGLLPIAAIPLLLASANGRGAG